MTFEWDDEKATANAAKHAISFGEAIAIWADAERVVEAAARPEDGELRSRVIGMIEGRLFIAVFTMRDETIRIISARRANKREEKAYGHHQDFIGSHDPAEALGGDEGSAGRDDG